MTTIKPTRRDRDAAQIYADWFAGSEHYRQSEHDALGQAFARHAAAERAMERAAIVAMIERDFDAPHVIDLARRIAEAIARAE